MRIRAKALRPGFVLPMALVLTWITLTVVGASAYYCTTAMATSGEYLSRTRCRLAAQSAIEKTKLLVQEACNGPALKIADVTSANFGQKLSETVEGVGDSPDLQRFLEDMRWDEAHRNVSDTTVWVDIKADSGVYNIYATAEVRKGGRKTTVTLQEGIEIPVSDANIFLYAYYVNGDGHLVSKDMVVNGDVRANGDFYLSGVNVNGFIYASNEVHLAASSAKNWWDGRYVTIRTAASYNAKYRSGKYSKARPTNPLNPRNADSVWEGGFREPEDVIQRKSLIELIRDFIDFITGRSSGLYDDGEMPITDGLKKDSLKTKTAPRVNIVQENKSGFSLPRIVSDSEPETDNDTHLDYYRTYAASAKTPKGRTGGSLVCSNSFVRADGTIEQLSAQMVLSWSDGNPSTWDLSEGAEDRTKLPEGVDPSKTLDPKYNEGFEAETDREKASLLFPEGSIPVYNCIPADVYDALPNDKKASWRMLSGNRPAGVTIAGDGLVGSFDGGFANFDRDSLRGMYNDTSIFNDGKGLFFTQRALEGALNELSALDGEASEKARMKFGDGSWRPCEAEYDGDTWEKGVEVVDSATQNLEVYGWKTENPLTWTRIRTSSGNTGYCNTAMGVKTVPVFVILGYVDIDVEGGFFTQSSLDKLANGFAGYNGVSAGDPVFTEWGDGWSPCSSGYYSAEDRYLRGYWVFHLIRTYERGVSSYSVQRQYVEKLSSVVRPRESKENVSNYRYTGNYYSSQPAGYLGITVTTNWVEQTVVKDVKFEYTPFVPETMYEPVPARTNLVDVQFMTLRPSRTDRPGNKETGWTQVGGSGAIQKGYNHDGTGIPTADFAKVLFNETELTPIAEKFAADYDLDASDVTGLFGSFDGWSHFEKSGWTNPSVWYKASDGSKGFVAVRLYEVTKGSEHLGYFVDYAHATATEKSAIEKTQQAAQASDVVETLYIPLHEYKSSLTTAERNSGKWAQLSSWTSGYQDTSTAKTYKGRFILKSDITDTGKVLDDSYDVGANALLNNFTGTWSGWTSRTSGWYNTDPSGYFRIKVTKKTTSYPRPSTTYSLGYSYVANWSGAADEEPAEIPNEVPEGSIPVYGLSASESGWKSVSSVSGGGYRNSASTQFVKASELDDVVDAFAAAAAADGSHKRLTADALRDEVMSYFIAAGWKSAGTGGRYKENPIGYLTLSAEYDDANRFRELGVDFHVLSVDAGEIGYAPGKKVVEEGGVDEDYYKEHPEEWWQGVDDGTIPWTPTVTIHTREPVTRQLRGIFVRDGNRLVTDSSFTIPETKRSLTVPPEDLVLAGDRMARSGDTTAELYPFREDADCGCNRRNEGGTGIAPDRGAVILIGTWDCPIMIDGPVVFESDVMIRGFVSGRGTIYSGRNIHIIGDICYKNPPFWPYGEGQAPETKGKDLLMLVARGSIVVGNYAKVGGAYVDPCWEKLLGGNYINGRANSNDALSRGVPYVRKDYTQNDTTGGTNYKIAYLNDGTAARMEREPVKYYESVIGDYVLQSLNDTTGNQPRPNPAKAIANAPYCDCRFAQTWDFNFGDAQSADYIRYACYCCTAVENYVNARNWTENDRVGVYGSTPGRSFARYLWDTDRTEFLQYVRSNYAYGMGTNTRPKLGCIQAINAVLYASQGIYGSVGGHRTPCVFNGAVIAHEEALLPFARMQRTIFGSVVDDLKITINWDIRLNKDSGDSTHNDESGEGFGWHMRSRNEDARDPGEPIPVSWQEVPDEFNEEYRATP